MNYSLLTIEEQIEKLYKSIDIFEPSQLHMDIISDKLKIKLHIGSINSQAFFYDDIYTIFIHAKNNKQERWQVFGHELSHVIKHVGDQRSLPKDFVYLQEKQAKNYMYNFCVPTFMLLNLNISNYHNIECGIDFVAETFNVTREFAKKRLEMFRNHMLQIQLDEKFIENFKNQPVMNYSKCVKPRKFPEHTKDIVALAISRKKSNGGISL